MSKKNIILTIAAFGCVVIISISTLVFSRISPWQVPTVLNNMRARGFCTCFFLLKKGRDYCLESVSFGYPMSEFEIDESNRAVKFSLLWDSGQAYVKESRLGCQLR